MADPVWHKTPYIEAFGTDPRHEPRLTRADCSRIRDEILDDMPASKLDWLLQECDAAIGVYCAQDRKVQYEATNKAKMATASALEKKCLELAEYIRTGWIISGDWARESEKQGHPAPSPMELEIDLEKFADLCGAASARAAARDMSGIKLMKPSHAASTALASAYHNATGKEPTCSEPRDSRDGSFSRGSQFYRLLEVVLTRCCRGRRQTSNQVAYAADHGIELWRAGRTLRYTTRPDLHE